MPTPSQRTGVIAKKLGMTRFFDDAGNHVPVTVLSLDGCQVVGQRTEDRDGYVALQLGAGAKKAKNTTQAERGHFAKALVEPKHEVCEFRVSPDNLISLPSTLPRLQQLRKVEHLPVLDPASVDQQQSRTVARPRGPQRNALGR